MCVRNTLGNWVILIFSGQKACTRIFKPHRFVFLHFSRPIDVISYLWCYYNQRQFLMGAPEKIHFKFHQNWENTQVKLPCIRFHFVKFVFSGSKKNLFFVVIPYNLLHYFIALENCEKECNMLEIILVQGFCPVFLMDFMLIICFSVAWWWFLSWLRPAVCFLY